MLVLLSVIQVKTLELNPSPTTCARYANEEFAVDIYRCQNSCGQFGRSFDCDSYKPHGDCYCKSGFARLTENGVCVPITDPDCAAQLPPTSDSCDQDEIFYDQLFSGHFSIGKDSCQYLKFPASFNLIASQWSITYNDFKIGAKWGPHCECKKDYGRLSNGQCVPVGNAECVALYQPSPEQCALRGEMYAAGPSCQPTAQDVYYGSQPICNNAVNGDCYCPAGKYRVSLYDNRCINLQDYLVPRAG